MVARDWRENMNIEVTRDDVRDFVESTSTHVPGVLVDAVVSELEAQLHLVGSHPESTVLTAATVPQWIAIRVNDELGQDKYDEILRNNVA
jgi:hypothetical protein